MKKIKQQLLTSLFLLLSVPFLFAFNPAWGGDNDPVTEFVNAPENVPDRAVGQLMPGGGFQIYLNRLVPTWPDNVAIQQFAIVSKQVGYCLIRNGALGQGGRNEAIPLTLDPNNYLLVNVGVVGARCESTVALPCSPPGEQSACRLNSSNNGCLCPVSSCQFTAGYVIPLSEILTLFN